MIILVLLFFQVNVTWVNLGYSKDFNKIPIRKLNHHNKLSCDYIKENGLD